MVNSERFFMRNTSSIMLIAFLILLSAPAFSDTGGQASAINSNDNSTSVTTNTTTTTTTVVNDGDANIVSAIYARYAKDSTLIGTALTVTCKDGYVTISGTVTSQSQADQAVILAKRIDGVKDATSVINVTTNPGLNKSAGSANY